MVFITKHGSIKLFYIIPQNRAYHCISAQRLFASLLHLNASNSCMRSAVAKRCLLLFALAHRVFASPLAAMFRHSVAPQLHLLRCRSLASSCDLFCCVSSNFDTLPYHRGSPRVLAVPLPVSSSTISATPGLFGQSCSFAPHIRSSP